MICQRPAFLSRMRLHGLMLSRNLLLLTFILYLQVAVHALPFTRHRQEYRAYMRITGHLRNQSEMSHAITPTPTSRLIRTPKIALRASPAEGLRRVTSIQLFRMIYHFISSLKSMQEDSSPTPHVPPGEEVRNITLTIQRHSRSADTCPLQVHRLETRYRPVCLPRQQSSFEPSYTNYESRDL